MIVGLTGGIGSGKSTVAQMFHDLGVPVFIADVEAKNLMNSSKELQCKIMELLGNAAIEDGRINRKFIAEKVFQDKPLLNKLNQIIHPAVRKHFLKWTEQQNFPYVIEEAAILFESGGDEICDVIITVTAPEDVRIHRVLSRDKTSEEDVRNRMKNQISDTEKIQKSHYVIENVDLEETRINVREIHQILLKKSTEI
ncbi:dephospho-CoA kinase [Pustulibacterium marinum]|uniref:Dephospho-CoA kinase n=1 Tax=Pustulibacterium marinum TaxID=1224947 RepID=A0A1I7IKY8_9FLAO|nr:dephospho-CoA kinase [Pustulibacterium marinum]SFU73566.1 dephospho-CoA kinase [Pustulibacterium marinum]